MKSKTIAIIGTINPAQKIIREYLLEFSRFATQLLVSEIIDFVAIDLVTLQHFLSQY